MRDSIYYTLQYTWWTQWRRYLNVSIPQRVQHSFVRWFLLTTSRLFSDEFNFGILDFGVNLGFGIILLLTRFLISQKNFAGSIKLLSCLCCRLNMVGPIEKIPMQAKLYSYTGSSIKISGWSRVRFPVFILRMVISKKNYAGKFLLTYWFIWT